MITSADQTLKAVPRLPVASCPQCGAAVSLPHDSDSVVCAACGSSLTKVGGVLVQVVSERVDVSRVQAEDALRAWISTSTPAGPSRGRSAVEQSSTSVGDLRFFPFLKTSGVNGERVTPLAALPSQWVAELGHAPGQMLDVTDHGQGLVPGSSAGPVPGPAQVVMAPTAPPSMQTAAPIVHGVPTTPTPASTVGGRLQTPPDPSLTAPDPTLVEEVLAQALTDQTVSRALVEYRGYYPAKYSLGEADDRPHAAIIAAGQGTVYGERPPARRRTARDQAVLLGTAALLMAEAGFVPGLQPRLAAVLVTALVAWIVLTWTVVRNG